MIPFTSLFPPLSPVPLCLVYCKLLPTSSRFHCILRISLHVSRRLYIPLLPSNTPSLPLAHFKSLSVALKPMPMNNSLNILTTFDKCTLYFYDTIGGAFHRLSRTAVMSGHSLQVGRAVVNLFLVSRLF